MKANEAQETYPMQFKDKIDEYLWKEHHIICGCCSSVESLKYTVAREVAEKLTDAFTENLECWLNERGREYYGEFDEGFLLELITSEEATKDFKKIHKRVMTALEKFQELPHINSLYEIQEDWAYTPNLYHFDGDWHVTWIHCEEGDALDDFVGSTPEEAIDKAYNWFHNKFKND